MKISQPRNGSKVDSYALNSIRQWLWWLSNAFFPNRCLNCERPCEDLGFCKLCAQTLPLHQNPCPICGIPFTGDDRCGPCLIQPPPFDALVAPYRYTPPVSVLIRQLKYGKRLYAARVLGNLLLENLPPDPIPDALIPVPLHWRRQFGRGFNQSTEIAKVVSQKLGVPLLWNVVIRNTNTPAQAGLPRAKRTRNLTGAFTADALSSQENIAVIDDVVTSSSTVAELSRCLKRAGVRTVSVWAVARA